MLKTLIAPLFLTLIAAACSKHGPAERSAPQPVPQSVAKACDQINLARDAAWDLSFVRRFLECVGRTDDAGESRFAASVRLLDQTPEGFDALLELIKTPIGEGRRLVLLEASANIWERGASGLDSPEAVAHRWQQTQELFYQWHPHTWVELFDALETSKQTEAVIDQIQCLEAKAPQGTFGVMARLFLTDESVREQSRVLAAATLEKPAFVEALRGLVWPRRYAIRATVGEPQQSFWAHALSAWSRLTQEQRAQWGAAVQELAAPFRDLDPVVVGDRLYQALRSVQEYAFGQQRFLTTLLDDIQVLRSVPLSDLEPLIQGLEQIEQNPSYRDAFEEKVGANYLHHLIEDFLWQGGSLASCSFRWEGLRQLPEGADLSVALQVLLKAEPRCQGRLPLLLWIDESLGLNCRSEACSHSWPVAAVAAPSSEELRTLHRFAGDILRAELLTQAGVLVQRHLAYQALDADQIRKLYTLWQAQDVNSLADLQRFEERLHQYPEWRGLLVEDFVEQWYQNILQRLDALSAELSDIWLDSSDPESWYQRKADDAMQRAALGLYTLGPGETALKEAAQSQVLKAAWERDGGSSQVSLKAWDRLLSPLRESAAAFRNPRFSFKPELEQPVYELSGSLGNALRFASDGRVEQDARGTQQEELSQVQKPSWILWDRYKDLVPLLVVDAPPAEATRLAQWMLKRGIPLLSERFQEQLNRVEPIAIPRALWAHEAISADELRHFTVYASQVWLGVKDREPLPFRFRSDRVEETLPREQAPRALLGISSLVGSHASWTGLHVFDADLWGRDSRTLRDALDQLVAPAPAIEAYWRSRAAAPLSVTQGRLNTADRERLGREERQMLTLQLSSFLYTGRSSERLVPSLGFADYCPEGKGIGACPLQVLDYPQYKSYVQKRALLTLCPFVSGSLFSTSFQKEWLRGLGWNDSPGALKAMCEPLSYGISSDIPATYWEKSWTSLRELGVRPTLRTGLRALPWHWRALKAEAESKGIAYMRFQAMLRTPVLWQNQANARLWQREAMSAATFVQTTGFVDHVLSAYAQSVGDKAVSDAYKQLLRKVSGSDNLVLQALSVITETYHTSVSQGESSLAFGLRVFDRLTAEPKLQKMLSLLMERPQDPHTGLLLNYTLPQALKVGLFKDFAWDHPAYKAFGLALRSEERMLLARFVVAYDRRLSEVWETFSKLSRIFGTGELRQKALEESLDFFDRTLRAADREGELSALWVKLLHETGERQAVYALTALLEATQSSQGDLDNTLRPPLWDTSEQLVAEGLEPLLKLLLASESVLEASGDPDLWVKLCQSILLPSLKKPASELFFWLQDQRLGLRSPELLLESWRDPKLRALQLKVLRAFRQVPRELLIDALESVEGTADSMARTIHFLSEKLQWRDTKGASYAYGLVALDQGFADQARYLKQQVELLRYWLLQSTTEEKL